MRNRLLGWVFVAAALPALVVYLSPVLPAAEARPAGRPYVGISAGPTGEEAPHKGVLVHEVTPASPAARAGLKEGDVVVKVGDKDIHDFKALAEAVSSHKPGDQLVFHIFRGDKEQKLTLSLGEHQARKSLPQMPPVLERHSAFLGVQTQAMTADLKDRLGVSADKGALVTEVMADSPAAKVGLKQDDVITAVNGRAVKNPEELREAVHAAGAEKEATLSIVRGKDKMEVKARLEESPLPAFAFSPAWANRFQGDMPSFFGSDQRVKDLERKVQELEKQVHDLQQKLAQQKK